jgi:hypothetical protein
MTISPSDLPDRHDMMPQGRYDGVTDDGVKFTLSIQETTRQMTGNEMMKATIAARTRGRPGPNTLRVPETNICIIIDRQGRKDIRDNGTGFYHHGRVGSRNFREAVEQMISYYVPKPRTPGM